MCSRHSWSVSDQLEVDSLSMLNGPKDKQLHSWLPNPEHQQASNLRKADRARELEVSR